MSSPIHKFLFSPPSSPPRHHPAVNGKARASPVPRRTVAGDGDSNSINHSTSYRYGDSIVLDTPSIIHAPSPGPFSSLTSLKTFFTDSVDASFSYRPSAHTAPSPTSMTAPVVLGDEAYLSNKVPTPVKHVFELGPSLPAGMSIRHAHTHSRGPSVSLDGKTERRTHSRHQSQSKRKPSIMVHVEDADFDYEAEHSSSGSDHDLDVEATPKAPVRSASLAVSEDGTPLMEPAPRRPSWRMPVSPPTNSGLSPLTPQHSYAKMQYHRRTHSRPNVPSTPLPVYGTHLSLARSLARPSTLPRPLVRLLALVLLAVASYWFIGHSHAEVEGRLTFTGSYMRHQPARGSDWVPRQANGDQMLARASNPLTTRLAQYRPLPPSHELLALQSYLLDSKSNIIPAGVDTSKALDAHLLLPISLLPRNSDGSDPDTALATATPTEPEGWLLELEREHEDDITIFHMDTSSETSSRIRRLLEGVHGKKRHPASIDLKTRGQVPAVLHRLGYPLDKREGVLVMMGNEPLLASQIFDMSQQELEAVMRAIGWKEEKKSGKKKVLVQAQWKKKPELGGGHEEVAAENAKLRR